MSKRDFYVSEAEMDDIQRKVIRRRTESSFIVRGSAGSGKSVIAFWKLHDIVSNNKGTAQIIVFTKTLKEYFEYGCRGKGIDPSLIDYWENWRRNPRQSEYILVDEAQDFSEASIEMFRRHATKALLLYGDTSQQLYSFRKGADAPISMEEIKRITGFPDDQLVYNHRLPVKIAVVAEYLNTEHDDLVDRCKNEGSEKPSILRYPSRDEQLAAIAEMIRSRNLDDVGILLPRNDQVKVTWQYLQSQGLNVEAKYSENCQTFSNINFATDNPKIMTYHSAKGLQFDTVFLPECDGPRLDTFLEPLYVAMTRAYRKLYILHTGELPKALQAVPGDLYETSLQKEVVFL